MSKNWQHAAGILWPVLTEAATRRKTLTYGEIAPLIDTNPLSVGNSLGPIQDYCMEGRLAPLTAIVVSAKSGMPGGGFIAWDVDDIGAAHEAVFPFDWSQIPNPYETFSESETEETFAQRLIDDPASAPDVYARIKVRGTSQRIFRLALIQVYDRGCAFCGTTFRDALDAAHIKTWQECSRQERLATSNGLLLCATHHRLFDAHLMTLSESYKVFYCDPDEDDRSYSDIDRELTVKLHGAEAYLPKDRRHLPAIELLRWHHKKSEWDKVP